MSRRPSLLRCSIFVSRRQLRSLHRQRPSTAAAPPPEVPPEPPLGPTPDGPFAASSARRCCESSQFNSIVGPTTLVYRRGRPDVVVAEGLFTALSGRPCCELPGGRQRDLLKAGRERSSCDSGGGGTGRWSTQG